MFIGGREPVEILSITDFNYSCSYNISRVAMFIYFWRTYMLFTSNSAVAVQ